MAEKGRGPEGPESPMRAFFDNIWLLLALGIGLPTVIYTVWGLIEIMNVPYLPLVK